MPALQAKIVAGLRKHWGPKKETTPSSRTLNSLVKRVVTGDSEVNGESHNCCHISAELQFTGPCRIPVHGALVTADELLSRVWTDTLPDEEPETSDKAEGAPLSSGAPITSAASEVTTAASDDAADTSSSSGGDSGSASSGGRGDTGSAKAEKAKPVRKQRWSAEHRRNLSEAIKVGCRMM